MSSVPRVALFADSYHEVNGAAHTCRRLDEFVRRRGYPFLNVHCGAAEAEERTSPAWTLQLKRGCCAIAVDRDLHFDPLLFARRHEVLGVLREFRPELIHVTSPGDLGILGAWAAHQLRVPLVASWHTNVHEFAARRLEQSLTILPPGLRKRAANAAGAQILRRLLWFYGRAAMVLAPNQELVRLIASHSAKPVFLMTRGIDTSLFSPAHRDRQGGVFTLGFAGRLTPEKNVRLLAGLEQALLAAGAPPFEFHVIGAGSELDWLRANLRHGVLPGVLRGHELSRAYANMDVLVFPSETDTYGNVVLEALASGVPAIVTAKGGPKFLVRPGQTGFVASSVEELLAAALRLMRDGELLKKMKAAARAHAHHFSWDAVFDEEVYEAYRLCLGRRSPLLSAATAAGR
ncbi:MAG: glycosyltransferase [Acidobacteria bacterium]|nr:glycosyltransferase [Acidobacteriota bacterium]